MASKSEVRAMTGNEACAEGALIAGLGFFAGYPITPSSEIAEILSVRLPQQKGRFIQMEDEIASMGAVIGASLMGTKAMTATSGPGFSLKQENIGYAATAEIPCVIVNVMRGGPSTGLPTLPAQGDVMQARWGTHGDHPIIALIPNSVRETLDLTVRAFNLAERYRSPVVVLLDEIIGHVNERVIMPDTSEFEIVERTKPTISPDKFLPYQHTDSLIPPMVSFGQGYRYHVTGLVHDQTGFPTNNPTEIEKFQLRLNTKIEKHQDKIIDVEEYMLDDADFGIFAYGSTSRSARHALRLAREKGVKIGMLRPRVLWPFPTEHVKRLSARVDTIIVPELNFGQIAHEVEWATCGNARVEKINQVNGEPIPPMKILQKIMEIASD
ncbi:2-oxoacid:acceptor oxidoreductase subunit alpha [candidate division KSB1 bacterium]|nr:2-oxoacid:acceptor oxidoreductase subunit alpha [candidate division KSB1 bacterium]